MTESVNHDDYYKKKIAELETIIKTLLPKEKVFTVKFDDSWRYNTDEPYKYDLAPALGVSSNIARNRLLVGIRNHITGIIETKLTDDEFNLLYDSLNSYLVIQFENIDGVKHKAIFHKVASHSNTIIDYTSPPTAGVITGGIGHFYLQKSEIFYDTPCFGIYQIDNILPGATLEIKIVYV